MGLFVRNLVDVLKTEGEAFVANVIKSFSCKYNHDVDRYLKEDAILFTAMSSSVTHFVFDAESGLCVAYFALAHKPISFQEDVLSNNQRKRMERFCKQDPKTKLFNVSAYLIAQLGKNYNAADGKLITGGQVLDLAKDELRVAKKQVGGQVVFIEKEQGNASLDVFYRKNGFVPFDNRVSEEDGVTYDLMFSFLK